MAPLLNEHLPGSQVMKQIKVTSCNLDFGNYDTFGDVMERPPNLIRTFAFGITKVTIPTKVGIQESEKMRLDSVLQRNGLSLKYLYRYLFKLNRVSPNKDCF